MSREGFPKTRALWLGCTLTGLVSFWLLQVSAAQVFLNGTGAAAAGLHAVFSEPIDVPSHSGALPKQAPQGRANLEFAFSGGNMAPVGDAWPSWSLADSRIFGHAELNALPMSASLSSGSEAGAYRDEPRGGGVFEVVWEEVPYALLYDVDNLDVRFYCDNDTDFSHARYWGRKGCSVRGVKITLGEGTLAVGLELHEGDAFGLYGYYVEFPLVGPGLQSTLYVIFQPNQAGARLAVASPSGWTELGQVPGALFTSSQSWATASIPYGLITQALDPESLKDASVKLHIDYTEGSRRELFFFPVTASGGLASPTVALAGPSQGQDSARAVLPPGKMVCGLHLCGLEWGNGKNNIRNLPEEYLLYVRGLGVDWIAILLLVPITDTVDPLLQGIQVLEDEELRLVIRTLRLHGFEVFLNFSLAFLRVSGDWYPERWYLGDPWAFRETGAPPEELWPWAPTHARQQQFAEEFFQSYTRLAVRYAAIAEQEGVALLGLGTETDFLFRTRPNGERYPTEFGHELVRMVQTVREAYHGPLTYGMNWSSLYDARLGTAPGALWGDLDLDIIGISAYFALFETPHHAVPSVVELRERWQRVFDSYLAPLRARYPDKPILFTEFGISDTLGATQLPGKPSDQARSFIDENGNGLDDGEEEQANCYQALFQTIEANPGIVQGLFALAGRIQTAAEWEATLALQREYSVRRRLAENVIREWYGEWSDLPAKQPSASADENSVPQEPMSPMGPSIGQFQASRASVPGAPAPAEPDANAVWVKLGRSLCGLAEWSGGILANDWDTGTLYFINAQNRSVGQLMTIPCSIYDFVVEGDTLYAGLTPDCNGVMRYSLTTGTADAVELVLMLTDDELQGIEKDGDRLYLLGTWATGQRLVVCDVRTGAVLSSHEVPPEQRHRDLLGLELYNGKLCTFDYASGTIFAVELTADALQLAPLLDIGACVPESERGAGGFRGFQLGELHICITSVGSAGSPSSLHILDYPISVVDDLKDGDFTNALSDVWRTLTQKECDAGGRWQQALPAEDAAANMRLRHVSAAIVDRQGQNWIDWSFDAPGWVALRTWFAPYDATHVKGVYVIASSAQDIDLSLGIDYRQVGSSSWEDAELRSASVPVHLNAGDEQTIVVPFDQFTLDDPTWVVQSGSALGDIDRSWLESVALIAMCDGLPATVYLREIGFYGLSWCVSADDRR